MLLHTCIVLILRWMLHLLSSRGLVKLTRLLKLLILCRYKSIKLWVMLTLHILLWHVLHLVIWHLLVHRRIKVWTWLSILIIGILSSIVLIWRLLVRCNLLGSLEEFILILKLLLLLVSIEWLFTLSLWSGLTSRNLCGLKYRRAYIHTGSTCSALS